MLQQPIKNMQLLPSLHPCLSGSEVGVGVGVVLTVHPSPVMFHYKASVFHLSACLPVCVMLRGWHGQGVPGGSRQLKGQTVHHGSQSVSLRLYSRRTHKHHTLV